MGMYDNFHLKSKVFCPVCKTGLPMVLQSRALGCVMRDFYVNEEILFFNGEIQCSLGNGFIIAYTVCDNCDLLVYFILKIRNGIWVETRKQYRGVDGFVKSF